MRLQTLLFMVFVGALAVTAFILALVHFAKEETSQQFGSGRVTPAFPREQAGVITLAPNARYCITGVLNMENTRLVCSTNTVLIGRSSSSRDGITGSTQFALISSMGKTVHIEDLKLSAPQGTIFDLQASATDKLYVSSCTLENSRSCGILQGGSIVTFMMNTIRDLGTGITFQSESGTRLFYGLNVHLSIDEYGTYTRLGGADSFYEAIEISHNSWTVPLNATGLSLSAQATVEEGFVVANTLVGPGTYLDTGAGLVDTTTPGWWFQMNGRLPNSTYYARLSVGVGNMQYSNFEALSYTALPDAASRLPLPVMAGAPIPWTQETAERFDTELINNDSVPTGVANPTHVPIPNLAAPFGPAPNGRIVYTEKTKQRMLVQWNGSVEVESGNNRDSRYMLGRGNRTASQIVAFANAGSGHVRVTTAGPWPFLVGDTIFIRTRGDAIPWQFVGPHVLTDVPSSTEFEFKFRDPDSTGYPAGPVTAGGEWVVMDTSSSVSISQENNEFRVFILNADVMMSEGDFLEPFCWWESTSGTLAFTRTHQSDASFSVMSL